MQGADLQTACMVLFPLCSRVSRLEAAVGCRKDQEKSNFKKSFLLLFLYIVSKY